MNIRIKTNLIQLEIEDSPTMDSDGYIKRILPQLPECIEKAIEEAVKLHNAVMKER